MINHNYPLSFLYLISFLSVVFIIFGNINLINQPGISKHKEIDSHIQSIFNSYKESDSISYWSKKEPLKCFIKTDKEEYFGRVDIAFKKILFDLNIPFESCKILDSRPPENSLVFLYFRKESDIYSKENKHLIRYFFPSPDAFLVLNSTRGGYSQFIKRYNKILYYIVAKKESHSEGISDTEIKRNVYSGLLGVMEGKITGQVTDNSIFGKKNKYTSLDKEVLKNTFNSSLGISKKTFLDSLSNTLKGR